MPLVVAYLFNVALGALCALAATRELRASPHALHRLSSARSLLVHQILVAIPVIIWPLLRATDWMLGYVTSRGRVPSAALLIAVLLQGVAGIASFALGARWIREHRVRAAKALPAIALTAALLGLIATRHRVAQVGTVLQFRGGFGLQPLAQSGLLGVLVALMGCWILAGGQLLYAVRRGGTGLR